MLRKRRRNCLHESELQDLQVYFATRRSSISDLHASGRRLWDRRVDAELSVNVGPVHAGIRFERPGVFAAHAEPNAVLPDSAEVKALDTIVSGLAARFGETDSAPRSTPHASRISRARPTTTSSSRASPRTRGSCRAGISPAGGLGVNLGFEASTELSSRVIIATKNDNLRSLLSAPLAAVKEMRGFIYPRSVEDIREMKPGEMFALRGMGKLGANFGVGAPIFVAGPVGPLTYSVVVSGGVAGVISGQSTCSSFDSRETRSSSTSASRRGAASRSAPASATNLASKASATTVSAVFAPSRSRGNR